MGKSRKLIKSLILGAKAFSKDRSPNEDNGKEQSDKRKSKWSLGKPQSCYNPEDGSEDEQDPKEKLETELCVHEDVFESALIESDLQSETTVVKPIDDSLEIGLSETVVEKPYDNEVSIEDENAVTKLQEEVSTEEHAAIVIQAAFRGFLCRRALRCMKVDTRVPDLVHEQMKKMQIAMTSRCVQALIKVQARVRARQVQMSKEGLAVQKQIQEKRQLQAYNAKSQEEWDHSPATINELQAKLQNKQEAAMRREKALAYAFSQQLRVCTHRKNQTVGDCIDPNQPHLGWTWLERWMAARPSDNTEEDILKKYLDDDQHERPQYGKIRKKKTVTNQQAQSPTRPVPYNSMTMKIPSPAKSKLSETPCKTASSGDECPSAGKAMNKCADAEGDTKGDHMVQRRLLFTDKGKEDVTQNEESCGSNGICNGSPKAADSSNTTSDSKLARSTFKSSGSGSTKLRIPNYMSTTQSSKAKIHHSRNDSTKPKETITATSTSIPVSTSV